MPNLRNKEREKTKRVVYGNEKGKEIKCWVVTSDS